MCCSRQRCESPAMACRAVQLAPAARRSAGPTAPSARWSSSAGSASSVRGPEPSDSWHRIPGTKRWKLAAQVKLSGQRCSEKACRTFSAPARIPCLRSEHIRALAFRWQQTTGVTCASKASHERPSAADTRPHEPARLRRPDLLSSRRGQRCTRSRTASPPRAPQRRGSWELAAARARAAHG